MVSMFASGQYTSPVTHSFTLHSFTWRGFRGTPPPAWAREGAVRMRVRYPPPELTYARKVDTQVCTVMKFMHMLLENSPALIKDG